MFQRMSEFTNLEILKSLKFASVENLRYKEKHVY